MTDTRVRLEFICGGPISRKILYHAQRLRTHEDSGLRQIFARSIGYGSKVATLAANNNTVFFVDSAFNKLGELRFPIFEPIKQDYTAGCLLKVPDELQPILHVSHLNGDEEAIFSYNLALPQEIGSAVCDIKLKYPILRDDRILFEQLFQFYEVLWHNMRAGNLVGFRAVANNVQQLDLTDLKYR